MKREAPAVTRILAVSTSYPLTESDTTAPFVRAISRGLCDHGCEITMLLPHHDRLAWGDRDGPVNIEQFRYHPPGWTGLQVWGYAEGLRSDISLRPAAVAVAPVALAATAGSLLSWAREQAPDLLHAHWVVPSGVPAALVSRITGIPLALSLHGSDVFLAERLSPAGWAARQAFRRARAVTACSRELAERAVDLGADPDSLQVIPYGVDTERFGPDDSGPDDDLRAAFGLEPDAPVILAVGRLVGKKGFRHLVDAVATLGGEPSTPELVIAGSGDQEAALREQARQHGLSDRVHLVGDVSRPRMPALYRAATILAVPSVRAGGNVDGLPNVLLEGMATGLPIAASRIAGIPDVIRHGENGLLARPGDAGDLADTLLRLLTAPELRRRLGRAARQDAEQHFGWGAITGRYAEVLRRAAEGGSR